MNSPESQQVIQRFFECAELLYQTGKVKNERTLAMELLNVPQVVLYHCKTKPSTQRFQMAWLGIIVKQFGVSAEYLLTGKGKKIN